MKLSDLRAALRKTKGNPTVTVKLPGAAALTLTVQKTSLLEELARAYDNDRNAQTGIVFDDGANHLSGALKGLEAHIDAAPDDDWGLDAEDFDDSGML